MVFYYMFIYLFTAQSLDFLNYLILQKWRKDIGVKNRSEFISLLGRNGMTWGVDIEKLNRRAGQRC